MTAAPEMSAILVTPDGLETIRRTVIALAAQTAAERLELVVVAPPAIPIDTAVPELDRFGRLTVIRHPGVADSSSRAKEAGIRAAAAPIVVLCEDHAFPRPEWAGALLSRFEGPWTAVGPVVSNGSPESMIAWSDHLIGYGAWNEGVAGGEVELLPGHNSAYRREALLAYGDELAAMLDSETVLHWDLRSRGHRLFLEPGAVLDHMGFGRLRVWTSVQFDNGRLFAARRLAGASPLRRLAYGLASPAIPLLRLARILRLYRTPAWPRVPLFRFLPVLAYGFAVDGAGQAAGAWLGEGDSMKRLETIHYHRERFAPAAR